MSVSRDSCAFIQSCFPLAGEQKKRKIFFSHTSGSLGASVCVGGEGRGLVTWLVVLYQFS